MNILQMARSVLRQFVADEEGATAVEYGLIVFLIAVAIVGSVTGVGTQLISLFGDVKTALTPAAAAGG